MLHISLMVSTISGRVSTQSFCTSSSVCVVSTVRLARRLGVVACSERSRRFAVFIGASKGGLDIEDALLGLALARRSLDGVRQGAL